MNMDMDKTPTPTAWIGYNDDSELFAKAYNILIAHYGTNRNETDKGMAITAKKCDVVCMEGGDSAALRSIAHRGDDWEVICMSVNVNGYARTFMRYLGISQADFDAFVRGAIITEEALVLERLAIAKVERIAQNISAKIAVQGWGLVKRTDDHICIANGNRKIEVKTIDVAKQLFCHAMTVERFLIEY